MTYHYSSALSIQMRVLFKFNPLQLPENSVFFLNVTVYLIFGSQLSLNRPPATLEIHDHMGK